MTPVKELVSRLNDFAEHLEPARDVYADEIATLSEAANKLEDQATALEYAASAAERTQRLEAQVVELRKAVGE